MDKKFEDKIAKMAFGELTEAEAAEVRAHTASNADAARALDSYEALRSDLRRMKEVPPDQLSKERLQNAILAGGLKPKPVRRAFPWAWATPVAVMGALALMLVMRPSDQQVALNDGSPSIEAIQPGVVQPVGNIALDLNADDRQILDQFAEEFRRSNEPVPVGADLASEATTRRSPRSAPRSNVRQTDRGIRTTPVMGRSSLAGLEPVAPAEMDTLVLINNDRDDSTGASTAVEVKPTEAQDVVISS